MRSFIHNPRVRSRFAVAISLSLVLLLALTGCTVAVPNLTGLTLAEATARIEQAGLVTGSVNYDAASKGATWTVVGQSVSGGSVDRGSKVSLVLAGGAPTLVPAVTGIAQEGVEPLLGKAGLKLGATSEAFNATVTAGQTISQAPAVGTTVPQGSAVDVIVSRGPQPAASDAVQMTLMHKISGAYSPKSVVAAPGGLVFAQNMIYRHMISVLDAATYKDVKTISDQVKLADYGFSEYSGSARGGPVEAAVAPDGKHLYVSNYSMYGPGFSHPGDDVGGPGSGVDPSFVYRIDLKTLAIDQVIKVGSVPKYVSVTPDGKYVLVSNWISYTLSVIDAAQGKEVRQIKLGPYPRGIAVDSKSQTAYVAVMGSTNIAKVNLSDFSVSWIKNVGSSPRHLVISSDDRFLYATLNGSGTVIKIDLATGATVGRVATGSQPRSMTIAEDDRSLYVVNYESDSMSKVRTEDMKVLQVVKVGHHPIGITYVNSLRDIWVCCYSGSFYVFHDPEKVQ